MRIGIDGRLWNETGVGRYIRNLVRELQEIDKKNEYVLFIKPEDEQNVKFQISNVKFQIVATDIHWHSLSEQVSFARILNQQRLDLMHFPYFSLPILYRKPFVVTIHDLIIHNFATGKASTLPMPIYNLKRLGFKRVFRHALNRSVKIIVPLQTVKSELLQSFALPAEKIVVTKEGFDPLVNAKGDVLQKTKEEVKKGKYFLYVGNAYPHKNVEFLLEAFSKFNSLHPEYRLLLVGKSDYFYRQLEKNITLSSVSLLHNVTDTDLGFLYENAEAFVSASLMEGFGLPALEAMAKKCLVLVSTIPSFREVCGDNAFYFDPKYTQSLSTALEKIITLRESEKKKVKESAFSSAQEYSWRKMAEETLRVYETAGR